MACLGDGSYCLAQYETCRVLGRSQYSSFSGVLLDSQSTCEVSFLNTCDVVPDVSISVQRHLDGHLDLHIAVPSNHVWLFANGSMTVNGAVVSSGLLNLGSQLSVARSSSQTTVQLGTTLSVIYSPGEVDVRAITSLVASLCGICKSSVSFTNSQSMWQFNRTCRHHHNDLEQHEFLQQHHPRCARGLPPPTLHDQHYSCLQRLGHQLRCSALLRLRTTCWVVALLPSPQVTTLVHVCWITVWLSRRRHSRLSPTTMGVVSTSVSPALSFPQCSQL